MVGQTYKIMLKNKDTQGLKDTHFPTLNLDKPQELSKQEKEIISDLKKQFLTTEKLKHCIQIFLKQVASTIFTTIY